MNGRARYTSARAAAAARAARALERAAGGVMLRFAGWLLALALVALPVVGVVNGWFAADRWPFRQLRIDATFERVNAEQVRAAAIITDGEIEYPKEAMPYSVLWVLPPGRSGTFNPPYGRVVGMDTEQGAR